MRVGLVDIYTYLLFKVLSFFVEIEKENESIFSIVL